MDYRIKSIKAGRLLLTTLIFQAVMLGSLFFLSSNEIVSRSNPILLILLFGGVGGSLLYFFFGSHGEKVCTITSDEVVIGNTSIKWNEIKSYKIRDDSSELKILKIKTNHGKTISIGHRKRHAAKDDFESFVSAFEEKVFNLNQENYNISKIPLIWETKWGKPYGYVIAIILVVYGVILFIKGGNVQVFSNYLILAGISIPILIRVFMKRKND